MHMKSMNARVWLIPSLFFGLICPFASAFQFEPQQDLPSSNRRLKPMVGAWEGAGNFPPGERLHQLLVIERRDGAFVAEYYQFRFPKDAVMIPVEAPLVNGNRISLAASQFPARFEGRLNRETGQLQGRWMWREKALNSFVMNPVKRRDANQVRFPLGKPSSQKIRIKYAKPKQAEYGLKVGQLSQAGLRWKPLHDYLQRVAKNEFGRIHGILLARGDQLVLEKYFYSFEKDDLHEIRSVQKGLVALLMMKLMDDGEIDRVEEPIKPFFDPQRTQDWTASGKDEITIAHLLTMSSGLDAEVFGSESRVQNQSNTDWVDYMLDAPLRRKPGEAFQYHGAAMNLLVAIAELATQSKAQALFEGLLLKPMGIEKCHFYHDPSGRLYGAGGGAMRPRDLLKFGMLVTSGGRYSGKTLISQTSMARMLAPTEYTLPFREQGLSYGYLWYIRDYVWPDMSVRTYQARGAGGQVIVAIPDWKISWVMTGGNYLEMGFMQPSIEAFMNSLKLANKDAPSGVSLESP